MNDGGLIKLHLDLPNHWRHKGESLWAKPVGADRYEIRNVPFCAYGLNFGDVVLATRDDPDLKPEIRRVVTGSGHQTLRMFFTHGVEQAQQGAALERLIAMGVEVERADARFVCLDLPPEADYQAVRGVLDTWETERLLAYETCEARVEGSFDACPGEND